MQTQAAVSVSPYREIFQILWVVYIVLLYSISLKCCQSLLPVCSTGLLYSLSCLASEMNFTVCILGLDGICVECNNTYNNYMLRLSEIPGSWYLYLKVEQYFFIHLLNYLCFTLSKLSTYNCHYFSYNCLYQTLKFSPFQTFYQLSQYLSWTLY